MLYDMAEMASELEALKTEREHSSKSESNNIGNKIKYTNEKEGMLFGCSFQSIDAKFILSIHYITIAVEVFMISYVKINKFIINIITYIL